MYLFYMDNSSSFRHYFKKPIVLSVLIIFTRLPKLSENRIKIDKCIHIFQIIYAFYYIFSCFIVKSGTQISCN